MVFYRKYRPQKIDELDLVLVREKLFSILSSSNIPHALLFTGSKGLGKTSAARIFAKALNCKKRLDKTLAPQKIEPCNSCDSCVSITNGSNLDVLEIDAASNRGIDEIRSLREKIKFAPVSSACKVYIIDEVHMLTSEAFNALLKTLEEPPSATIFILCTTEVWRLPPTIVSRAFQIEFQKPTQEELVRSLKRIIKGEALEIDNHVLFEVYKLSEGSFRDGAKIIQELALHGKKISREMLESLYKTSSIQKKVFELLTCLSKRQTKEALLLVEDFVKNGADFKVVIEKTVEYLRLLLLKHSGIKQEVADIEGFDIASINKLIEYFGQAYVDLKYAVLPSLPVEIVVVKWNEIENSEFRIQNSEFFSASPLDSSLGASLRASKVQSSELGERENASFQDGGFFAKLIETVKNDNHSIAGVLRGARLVGLTNNDFTIETSYKFHNERLNDAKIKTIIEKRAAEITGKTMKLTVHVKENKK